MKGRKGIGEDTVSFSRLVTAYMVAVPFLRSQISPAKNTAVRLLIGAGP